MQRDKEDSRHSAEDQYWQSLDATRLITAHQCKRQRDMRISCYTVELEILPRTTITPWRVSHSDVGDSSVSRRGRVSHSDVGDSSVSRRGRVFKEKDRPYDHATSGLTNFSRKDDGERKIHYGRRTRDVAGRNRKHQNRVKRKRNTMIEEKSIMRSA